MENMELDMFRQSFRGKSVVVTGHTGFKGAWLSAWLVKLGAKVTGLSLDIPTTPSMFEVLGLQESVDHNFGDVRDIAVVNRLLDKSKPDFVFHLAAQPIVSLSYSNPLETLSVNMLGTATVLEALRQRNQRCVGVIVTSDKCYENVSWPWGYRETDHLGGKDIYSASKGAAEIAFHAYYNSFFKTPESNVILATGRAGNVIGGGDWARDRIVVDCVRQWSEGRQVEIRSPDATRPWQHVLEPLSGYLTLASNLSESENVSGESFNFGPRAEQNRTVADLIEELQCYWTFPPDFKPYAVTADVPFDEASLLKLICDKALFYLKWEPTLHYSECVQMVGEWYSRFYGADTDMVQFTKDQIDTYEKLALERGAIWTQ